MLPSLLIMPFCKRTILPKDVCKPAGGRLQQEAALEDLVDVCGFSLCSLLRQLSDLSRHSVSILEELEGDLATICHRSCVLEGRVVRLQRRVTDLISKPPPKGKGPIKEVFFFKSRTRRESAERVRGGDAKLGEENPKRAAPRVYLRLCLSFAVISAGRSGNFSQLLLFRLIMSSVNCFCLANFHNSAFPNAPEGSASWV